MKPIVKICGITTLDALEAALAAGADMIGLVFFPPSPRNVSIPAAARLAARARGEAEIVALTVDADDDMLETICRAIDPDVLQLHGNETPERVAEVRRRTGKRVMKAIKVATREDAQAALAYRECADSVLFDARPPQGADRPGGHGVTFDWAVLDGIADQIPFMLSGGLTPENVTEAIRRTRARAVDVSSGVESAPGVKSPDLIAAFLRAAKATTTDR